MHKDKNLTPWTTKNSEDFEYCMIVGVGFALLVGLVLVLFGALIGMA